MDRFWFEVLRTGWQGILPVRKFGRNPDVSTSEETCWPEGGIYSWPSSATTMTISSASANDASAGTGARTVEIHGLDSNYDIASETATLNGQTEVTLTNQYLRVHRMVVQSAGSGGKNDGIVYVGSGTVTTGKPANVYSLISAGHNQTLQCFYTVPNGYDFYAMRYMVSASSGKTVSGIFYVREFGKVFAAKTFTDVYQSAISVLLEFPDKVPAKADIDFRCVSSAASTSVAGEFAGVLVPHGTSWLLSGM